MATGPTPRGRGCRPASSPRARRRRTTSGKGSTRAIVSMGWRSSRSLAARSPRSTSSSPSSVAGRPASSCRRCTPELQQRVAIKVLREAGGVAAERMAREARATVALQSEHVVRVMDVGRDHGRVFLVMEKLEGSDLARGAQAARTAAGARGGRLRPAGMRRSGRGARARRRAPRPQADATSF